MTYFGYGVLRSDKTDAAHKHNERLLGAHTLGIEVTNPVLAARCGLGNIDPQHTGTKDKHSSAIELALSYELPPEGTCLVTVRPDKDACGAMAVFSLRAQGRDENIDLNLISWIGALDSMGFDNACVKFPELYGHFQTDGGRTTTAIQTIARSPEIPLSFPERIEKIAQILIGEMPQEEVDHYASKKDVVKTKFDEKDVELYGDDEDGIAFIEAPGQYRAARNWMNKRYRVAIIFDPEYRDDTKPYDRDHPYPRWTIVRQLGVFDRKGFEAAINEAEARKRDVSIEQLDRDCKWGGPNNIVVSAKGQGHETWLSKDEILDLVWAYADPETVS